MNGGLPPGVALPRSGGVVVEVVGDVVSAPSDTAGGMVVGSVGEAGRVTAGGVVAVESGAAVEVVSVVSGAIAEGVASAGGTIVGGGDVDKLEDGGDSGTAPLTTGAVEGSVGPGDVFSGSSTTGPCSHWPASGGGPLVGSPVSVT
jgi:hypothetical protein